ncbi:MAG TPA: amidohydrolase [bacterium]|nr:amidohydrolase [bacterium]
MPSKEELKQAVCAAIDQRREEIVRIGDTILRHPETGFTEVNTARLVAEQMERLGLRPQTGLAITGVKGRVDCGAEGGAKAGPTLAILGELDSLRVSEHPLADHGTGAAHACGHNAQVAGMLGAAMGLLAAGAPAHLAGSLVFFAVPAEEMIDVEFRLGLREQRKLEFLTGKGELIRLGHFDDVDLAMMIHTKNDDGAPAYMAQSSNGAVIKKIRFLGRAAHAGSKPQAGINALNAANLAMTAIALNRETFYDDDTIRIHPIITKGGDAVSVVPAEVTLETFVRGKTLEGIVDANRKVDRCLRGAAMAIGAEVEIQTIPGYLPQRNNLFMGELFGANARDVMRVSDFPIGGHRTGSTDMGDVGHIMPVIHPYVRGASGNAHAKDWSLTDPNDAYVTPAKLLACTAIDLLYGDAEPGRRVLAEHPPKMTKDAYLQFCRELFTEETYSGE